MAVAFLAASNLLAVTGDVKAILTTNNAATAFQVQDSGQNIVAQVDSD